MLHFRCWSERKGGFGLPLPSSVYRAPMDGWMSGWMDALKCVGRSHLYQQDGHDRRARARWRVACARNVWSVGDCGGRERTGTGGGRWSARTNARHMRSRASEAIDAPRAGARKFTTTDAPALVRGRDFSSAQIPVFGREAVSSSLVARAQALQTHHAAVQHARDSRTSSALPYR